MCWKRQCKLIFNLIYQKNIVFLLMHILSFCYYLTIGFINSGKLKIHGFLVMFGRFVFVLNVDDILDGKFSF